MCGAFGVRPRARPLMRAARATSGVWACAESAPRAHLKDGHRLVALLLAVDLVARRVEELALGVEVALQLLLSREGLEVKLAVVEHVGARHLLQRRIACTRARE
eukprot:2672943-Prymnesium_polylepis.1